MAEIEIDMKDKRLLAELSRNCRMPLSKISKNIGLSRQATEYRMKMLEKKGVIVNYFPIMDLDKLNFHIFGFFLQLQSLDDAVNNQMMEYMKKDPHMGWCGEGAGKWNLVIDIFSRDFKSAEETALNFIKKFEQYVSNYILYPVLYKIYLPMKFFNIDKNEDKQIYDKKSEKEIKFGKKDIEILKLLNANAKIKLTEITDKIKMTPNGIKDKIRKMLKSGIIKEFTILVNHQKLNYSIYDFLVNFKYIDFQEEKKFISFLKNYPGVIYYYRYIGEWNFEIGLIAKKIEDTKPFLMELRGIFKEKIQIMELNSALSHVKWQQIPDGVFDDLLKEIKN